ncbi:unnamed protein product [Lactuca virosa]|uniref:Uncharacterized protein n=1 Tax=Lactuca virosa TaxID=75947 RepID=A0AAU9MU77_9ASTR|nr:unnamed protein product [Lactuca virosa]
MLSISINRSNQLFLPPPPVLIPKTRFLFFLPLTTKSLLQKNTTTSPSSASNPTTSGLLSQCHSPPVPSPSRPFSNSRNTTPIKTITSWFLDCLIADSSINDLTKSVVVARGTRILLPWELLQPFLRILGHCLPGPLNLNDMKDAISTTVRYFWIQNNQNPPQIEEYMQRIASLCEGDQKCNEKIWWFHFADMEQFLIVLQATWKWFIDLVMEDIDGGLGAYSDINTNIRESASTSETFADQRQLQFRAASASTDKKGHS